MTQAHRKASTLPQRPEEGQVQAVTVVGDVLFMTYAFTENTQIYIRDLPEDSHLIFDENGAVTTPEKYVGKIVMQRIDDWFARFAFFYDPTVFWGAPILLPENRTDFMWP